MELHGEETGGSFNFWRSGMADSLVLKEKASPSCEDYCKYEKGLISAEEYNVIEDKNFKKPLILISEDDAIEHIEMAKIESCHERILTPEGNVKYKNYRILAPAPAPIRMYSPSGDIHTTPKKNKLVSKFQSFHESLMPREKILNLIDKHHFASAELREIIRPNGFAQRAMDIIRRSNKSSMGNRIEFLNSLPFSPSPSSLSIFSDDSSYPDSHLFISTLTPEPVTVVQQNKLFLRAKSVELKEDNTESKHFVRQISISCEADNPRQMNLSEELKQADSRRPVSHTPRKMTDFEYSYFHRPLSSLSTRQSLNSNKPKESKQAMLRNFVQRNMIDKAVNRDKLAKLALAIEEDFEDEDVAKATFVTSARAMEERLENMLDETKELREKLVEIQDNLQNDDDRVVNLIAEARALLAELKTLNYLDDIISLLNGNLQVVALNKIWPFAQTLAAGPRDPSASYIV